MAVTGGEMAVKHEMFPGQANIIVRNRGGAINAVELEGATAGIHKFEAHQPLWPPPPPRRMESHDSV